MKRLSSTIELVEKYLDLRGVCFYKVINIEVQSISHFKEEYIVKFNEYDTMCKLEQEETILVKDNKIFLDNEEIDLDKMQKEQEDFMNNL